MDPFTRFWMFENWLEDQADKAELAKNHAYLLGSFWNPEAVKKMMGDAGNTHSSSDEDFEKSTKMIVAPKLTQDPNKPKRKRKNRIKV